MKAEKDRKRLADAESDNLKGKAKENATQIRM